jgi:mono/diheme cytochrome c family protein
MSGDRAMRTRRAGALALTIALSACSWFTDFKEQPKVDPWESPNDSIPMRGNPQNSVSIYGSAAPGYAVSRSNLPTTIDSMASIPNPIPADARSLLNGRKYYTINCAVCHGYEGKGDGAVVAKGFPPIPLVGAASPAPGRTDGYIWGMIRNGRGLMPSYNRIEELDRWDVVNYVRGLQGRYAVQTGPVGLPGETGDKLPGYSEMGPTRPSPYYVHAGSQAGPAAASSRQAADTAARPAADSAAARRDSATTRPSTAAPGRAAPTQPTMTPNTGGAR